MNVANNKSTVSDYKGSCGVESPNWTGWLLPLGLMDRVRPIGEEPEIPA